MKTSEIMNPFEMDTFAGPQKFLNVVEVYAFVQRVRDRLQDVEDGMNPQVFEAELIAVQEKLR